MRADFEDDGILNQSNGATVDYSDNTAFAPGDGIVFAGATRDDFTADTTGVACFTAGSLIDTPDGPRPIDELRPGDLVLTRDDGAQPVRWIGSTHLDRAALDARPKDRPIRIRKGRFGAIRDTLVSPQHCLLVEGERFARATHLVKAGRRGLRRAEGRKTVTYVHLLLDRHAVLRVDGVASESFYPGALALKAMAPATRKRLEKILPPVARITCRDTARLAYGPTARPVLSMAELRALVLQAA
ncbi:Hint domain-containing protein [Maribius pontilimi]|uniref:Hint domain-containing protein n=2 Tax=Palleronia pontilimi TaxID=1964209 RepID=A0A934MBN8_9RHOB|nr:Hint domain-containing protein [Palleronia pontilimi]